MLKYFIYLFIFIQLNAFADSSDKNWGKIYTKSVKQKIKILKQLDIDITGISENSVDVLVNNNEFRLLSRYGLEVQLIDVKGVSRSPDERYKNPQEIEDLLVDYHQKFPHLTSLKSIGKSLEGRDIWAIKISDNPLVKEESEPVFLVNAMHHAREVMTPEVAIDMLDYLLMNYELDSQVKDWVDETEIWIIPMLNVDGNHKMWTKDKWWRKNTRNGYGVDLNRNYPSFWGSCKGSSGYRRSQTYRGPEAASEPETRAMMSFVENIRPAINISYHSYSELVIYPYGCEGEKTLNFDIVEGIGKQIAKVLNYKAGTSWETLYSTDGGDIDWMHDKFQVIPYVIEVNKSAQGFHPNYDKWRNKTVELNRKGWSYALNRLHGAGVIGSLEKNGLSVKDFTVEVYLKGIKKISYKSHSNGFFHLVLDPGEYELIFKKNNLKIGNYNIIVDDKLGRAIIKI